MSTWSTPVPAITVASATSEAEVTSTSTIVVHVSGVRDTSRSDERDNPFSSRWSTSGKNEQERLRMFNIAQNAIADAAPAEGFAASPTAASGCVSPPSGETVSGKQSYADSDRNLDFAFDAGVEPRPVQGTCIPKDKIIRRAAYLYVDAITDYTSIAWGLGASCIACTYRDPCVIEVPDSLGGGWLMLLTRYWVAVEDGTTSHTFDTHPGQDSAISDIIAYYSPDNASFSGANVQGPYLMVHSMQAVGHYDSAGGAEVVSPLRCHPEMPTGEFIHVDGAWRLFLYYSAPVQATRQWDSDAGAVVWSDGYKSHGWEVGGVEMIAAMESFDDGKGYTGGLVMKQIHGDTFLNEVVNNTSPLDETDWETGPRGLSAERYRVVRIWMATGSAYDVVSLRDEIETLLDDNAQDRHATWRDGSDFAGFTDPETARAAGKLLLFVRASATLLPDTDPFATARNREDYLNATPGGSLCGAWRTVAMEEGHYISADEGYTEYGRDFVVKAIDGSGMSDDLIAGDYYDNAAVPPVLYEYADPDAVHLEGNRTWRVFVNDGTQLVYVEASEIDVRKDWTDAW